MNFSRQKKEYILKLEESLKYFLPKPTGIYERVANAMKYSLMAGGKRLRPMIMLAAAESFGETGEIALPFASAMEMIHTYSLIHDDLPAMDNDDLRRGQPTCHKRFDEATAILAGDALLNRAFEIMLEAVENAQALHIRRFIKAARIISDASGINGMILGQEADIHWENGRPGEEELVFINKKKTGALISAAFEAGAVLGGADEPSSEKYRQAGMKIGIAFQIRDDILDCQGTTETLGKNTGSDEKNSKQTYMSVLGEGECRKRIETLTGEAIELIGGIEENENIGFLPELIRELENRKF